MHSCGSIHQVDAWHQNFYRLQYASWTGYFLFCRLIGASCIFCGAITWSTYTRAPDRSQAQAARQAVSGFIGGFRDLVKAGSWNSSFWAAATIGLALYGLKLLCTVPVYSLVIMQLKYACVRTQTEICQQRCLMLLAAISIKRCPTARDVYWCIADSFDNKALIKSIHQQELT